MARRYRHTPTNAFGVEQQDAAFHGGKLGNWRAPDLTANARTGLGSWSPDDIVQYLKTGRNAHSNAAGSMAEVVAYSTSQLSDADLHAIATYIKSLPAGATSDTVAVQTGAAIYADACTACHFANGAGRPTMFPSSPAVA
jgi:mono/diheme cytochrome c family protein